ncbi:hypothetical protein PFLU3_05610 [Pseudomonas fluorescens]|uniref:Uncharacterized protein n=1 Tax=Pseudomonas fluorescens TaxID=294 RepID=A0A0D0RWG4_PSEFL|nr:hypothetical protein C4K02_4879 [Pseudomonas synxantha]KIR23967.1 hypothetical protein PFLU3_05610 [Pseudomonas fluorescens]
MFNSILFNAFNVYSLPPSYTPDIQVTQPSEQVDARSKRSLDHLAPQTSTIDNAQGEDRARKKRGGGLDSLGRGNIL